MAGEHWKRLFREQGWIENERVSKAFADSEDIVVVMRSSDERCFFKDPVFQATEDFLVFQGVWEDRQDRDRPAEPYKVWLNWSDILSVWDYRDPLKNAFR